MTHLVAFIGPPGSGKTAAADYLVAQNGFKREKFAGPLKDMLRAIGLTEEEIEGELKEEPCDLLSMKTPRHAMQTLGTEWGRNCISQDFWVNLWAARVQNHRLCVVDDCRFENEATAVKSLGGRIIRIIRPGLQVAEAVAKHTSESHVDGMLHDHVITNDGSLADFYEQVSRQAFAR